MIRKTEDIVIYKDPFYYISFPSCLTLDTGEILLSCRRALDPRYLLGDNPDEALAGSVTHVEARSHQALVRLNPDLSSAGPVRSIPMNPEAADQDGSMLKLASGRILLSAFSWYPFPPTFTDTVAATGLSFHGSADTTGSCYLFWGGFTRHTDDGGTHWTDHAYLPPIPDVPDIVPGKRPFHGGGIRGSAVESDGEILIPTYSSAKPGRKSSAYVYASSDNGASWAFRAEAAVDTADVVDMHEPALYRTPSGRIICFIRTAGLDDHLVTTESTDNGRTWSAWQKREPIGHPYTPVQLPDGRVFLINGYRHEPYGIRARVLDPECSDIDTAEEFVIRDDGLGSDLGYPWATAMADGRVLATYYIFGDDGIRHIAGSVLEVD
jgi:hypothetical protein